MSYSFEHFAGMLLALIPALINVGLLVYGIVRLPQNKSTLLLLLFLLALICWQCNDVMMRISANEATARFWDKIFSVGVFAMAPLCLHFAAEYTSNSTLKSFPGLFFIYAPFAIFNTVYLALPSNTLFVYEDFWGYVNVPRPNSLESLQLIWIPLVIVLAVIVLFHFAYRVWQSAEIKWQALVIAIGMLVPTVQGFITQGMFYLLDLNRQIPVTSTVMTVFSIAVIIAFSRYRLFTVSEDLGLDIILRSLRDIVVIADTKTKTRYLNPYAQDILKQGNNYQKAWHISQLFSGNPKLYNEFKAEVIDKALLGISVKNYETIFSLPDGNEMEVIVNAETIRNNHIIQGALLIARDITDRKKMLYRLRTENMVFELLSRGLTEMEVLQKYFEEAQNEHHNNCICALFETEEQTGNWSAVCAPGLQKNYTSLFELFQKNGNTQLIQEAFKNNGSLAIDGGNTASQNVEFKDFLARENVKNIITRPVNSSSGKLLGILSVFLKNSPTADIDEEAMRRMLHITGIVLERGNAFQNIESQQKTYTDLVNTIDGIVYEYDLVNKKYEFVSNRAAELLGYPLDLWYSETDFQMKHAHPEDKALLDDIKNSFFPETSMECEYRMMAADGHWIWCRDYIRIVYKNEIAVRLKGVIIDITQTKNVELEKELAAADLIKRNRDLEQFTYIVSHNLRAPLANIMGCTNAMDIIQDEEDRKELIQGIADSANRLDSVVRDLNSILSIQRVSAEKVEKMDLPELIHDVIQALKPEWKSEFEIILKTEETPWLVSVKPYIYSIFHNLISNSYKYRNPKKSPVLTIETRMIEHVMEILFKDNGQGIDLIANKHNIFGMYKRFHTDVEGKGMGLFMVKAQVEALQGTIEVKSEVNRGTEFKILLPQ